MRLPRAESGIIVGSQNMAVDRKLVAGVIAGILFLAFDRGRASRSVSPGRTRMAACSGEKPDRRPQLDRTRHFSARLH